VRERVAAGQLVQRLTQSGGKPEQQRNTRREYGDPDAGGGLSPAVVEPLEDGGVRHACLVHADQVGQCHPDDEQRDRSGARPSRALKRP
jgi:hypothetical protein